jgi:hypothetical protein
VSDEQVGWTEEDDARVTYESLADSHPSVFRAALEMAHSEANELLSAAFVTPESLHVWGDFSRARAIFAMGLKISTTALFGIGAPDVAYVRLVETDEHTNHDIDSVPATMHATLVWRPEITVVAISSWRIHHIGDAIEPAFVPRTAAGFDPRTQS